MKNTSKEVSDSDDSDLIVDPSPVLSPENTRLDKSIVEKYLFDSGNTNNHKGNEAESTDSNSDDSGKIQKNSENKLVKKKKKSLMEVQVTAKKSSIKNGTSHVEATFNAEDLSSDEEVFVFHCPENFKKHDLLNQKINITKPKQFIHTEDGEKYQLKILNAEKKQVTLAIPEKSSEGRLINLPLRGHVLIQKILHMESDLINDLVETEQTVIFPTDIKIRHPFLGVDWKAYINSAIVAIEKNKKMRKKIKKERTEGSMDVENKKIKRKKLL